MSEQIDPGIRIAQMAKALTKREFDELLATHELDLWVPQSRRLPFPDRDGVYAALVERGLMRWRGSKDHGYGMLTEFGQRVMLGLVEYVTFPAPSDADSDVVDEQGELNAALDRWWATDLQHPDARDGFFAGWCAARFGTVAATTPREVPDAPRPTDSWFAAFRKGERG